MLHITWIVGALWVVGVDIFVRRYQRHANPRQFWLEAVETALVLIGLYSWVTFAVWLTT